MAQATKRLSHLQLEALDRATNDYSCSRGSCVDRALLHQGCAFYSPDQLRLKGDASPISATAAPTT
jgi:hypothetical protein